MGVFHLDVSMLSGTNVTQVETPLQERGQTIQVEWVQSGANQDLRLHGWAVRGVPLEVLEQDIPLPNPLSTSLSAYGSGPYGAGPYGTGGLGGSHVFILDTSVLGGAIPASSVHTPLQERGRSIQLEWVQAGGGQDLRLHGYAVRAVPTEVHSMETT